MMLGAHNPKVAEAKALPILRQEVKPTSAYLNLLKPIERESAVAQPQKIGSPVEAMDVVAIRNSNLANTAQHLIQAARSGGTAATTLAEWDKVLPKIPAPQIEIWNPLLNIIRQAADLQSRRESRGTGNWAVPLIAGLVVGTALCLIGVRLVAG